MIAVRLKSPSPHLRTITVFILTSVLVPQLVSQVLPLGSLTRARAITQYKFDRWQTDDGLPDNTINSILQSSDGYLWLGTQRGLSRFDGVKFNNFDIANTPGLLNNALSVLFEDAEGALWIGTGGGGLTRLKKGRFESFTTANGLSNNYISSIAQDSAGVLWIGTYGGGLVRYRDGLFEAMTTSNGLASNFVRCLFSDRQGILWVGTNGGGLNKLAHGRIERFSVKHGLPDDNVKSISQDQEGRLWIGTSNGLARYQDGRFIRQTNWNAVPNSYVASLMVDDEGTLWIGTNGSGLSRYDGKLVDTYTMNEGLANNFVSAVAQDTEGNIWIGTERGGLNRLRKTKVLTYTTKEGLSIDYVRSVFEDQKGRIWIGTNGGGINILKNGAFSVFTTKHGLSNDFIRPIFEDSKGTMWIGTWGGGVTLYRNRRFDRPRELEAISNKFIRAINEDTKGNIWIGTNGGGLNRYANGKLTVFQTKNGLSNDFVSSIAEDRAGAIWVGTSGGGLNKLVGDSITVFKGEQGLPSEFVTSLSVDHDGVLWIATNGGGICRFKDGTFTTWRSSDGLVDDIIYSILDDEEDSFWLSSTRGISRIFKRDLDAHAGRRSTTLHVLTFNEVDGMKSSECSGGTNSAACRTKDGRLWFPTVEGLVVVNPTTVKKDTFGFPVYIERIVIDKIAIDHEGPLEVDFGKGELEFHYTGITFRDARKVRFRYKLEGFDRDWQDVGTRRAAFYTNVPPGTYSFHVVANAGDGSINERATEMHITILPPFWMTGWFRVLIGLFAIGLVAGAVRYVSIKKLKRRLQVVEAQASLERERMRISKDMHDELGASLTKITLLGELAKRDIDKKEMMQQHLQRISDASRQVAETMDEIVWAVNPKNDSVDSLTAYLLQYVQEYLSMTDLQYKFDIPDELPENHVTAEVRHNMFLVVKEALNNTVKHASATEVRISVRYVDSRLGISLEDNGKGFSAETVGRFNDGLQNMRKRMEEIGGIFELESNPSRGTCLRISVNV